MEGAKILVKVNPLHLVGTELTIPRKGEVSARDMEFEPAIFKNLKLDGFEEVNAMEFNLYLSGLL